VPAPHPPRRHPRNRGPGNPVRRWARPPRLGPSTILTAARGRGWSPRPPGRPPRSRSSSRPADRGPCYYHGRFPNYGTCPIGCRGCREDVGGPRGRGWAVCPRPRTRADPAPRRGERASPASAATVRGGARLARMHLRPSWRSTRRRTARVEPGVVLDEAPRRGGGATILPCSILPVPCFNRHPYRLTFGARSGVARAGARWPAYDRGTTSCGLSRALDHGREDRRERRGARRPVRTSGARMTVGPDAGPRPADRFVAEGGPPEASVHAGLRALRDRHARPGSAERFPDVSAPGSGYNLRRADSPSIGFDVARAAGRHRGHLCGRCSRGTDSGLIESPPARGAAGRWGIPRCLRAAADACPRGARAGGLHRAGGISIRSWSDGIARHGPCSAATCRLLPEGAGWLLAEFGGAERV
jgi:hypothetical protein